MSKDPESYDLEDLSVQELIALANQEFEVFKTSIQQKDLVAGNKSIKALKTILDAAINDLDLNHYFSQSPVDVQHHSFCFTGDFIYGDRKKCEKAIIDRGGKVLKSPSVNLDYLVVGAFTNENWAHASYGRKIECAIQIIQQQTGFEDFNKLHMLTEEHWLQQVLQIESVEFRKMFEDRLSE
jgi:NAD-dependent DNA ligase